MLLWQAVQSRVGCLMIRYSENLWWVTSIKPPPDMARTHTLCSLATSALLKQQTPPMRVASA